MRKYTLLVLCSHNQDSDGASARWLHPSSTTRTVKPGAWLDVIQFNFKLTLLELYSNIYPLEGLLQLFLSVSHFVVVLVIHKLWSYLKQALQRKLQLARDAMQISDKSRVCGAQFSSSIKLNVLSYVDLHSIVCFLSVGHTERQVVRLCPLFGPVVR